MTQTDSRHAAAATLTQLIEHVRSRPGDTADTVVEECQALARAVAAFHMEGIRFRMFNVDRLLADGTLDSSGRARTLLEEVRRHLEAAGFYTRSHQAPTQ